jgi:hypothetical protein
MAIRIIPGRNFRHEEYSGVPSGDVDGA